MKGKRLIASNRIYWALFLVLLLWGYAPAQSSSTIAKTIDSSNCKDYESILVPAVFRAVQQGDLVLPTGKLSFVYKHSDKFMAASEKNAGKFTVNTEGDLIDKKTSEIPTYNIYGFPFPQIDPKDSQAAVKIIWNFNYNKYRFMGMRHPTELTWIGKGGRERANGGVETIIYLQGRPPGQEIPNPQNYLTCEIQKVDYPMSAKGTNQLSIDYFDIRDFVVYTYIPVIRRVRQASGVARSDATFGSDAWADLNYNWGGKNRTMRWKLVGEKTVLVPFTSTEKIIAEEEADGTMIRKIPDYKFVYNTPGAKGVAWSPTTITWIPRDCWVVEQVPKDPYYNWGLHVNYIDKETSVIWIKEVYDKAGQFRTWRYIAGHYQEGPSGNNSVGDFDFGATIDERSHHATMSQRLPGSRDSLVFMPASRLNLNYFTMNNFLKLSK